MRSSIFHSDRSGTGWSAGDNRWSQLFRWPGKSSNRPGPKNCAAHQKYSMDEKKKRKKKKRARDYTFASLWPEFDLYKFFRNNGPAPGRPWISTLTSVLIFAEQNGSRVSTRCPLIDSLFHSLPPFIIAHLPPTLINRRRGVWRLFLLIFITNLWLFIRP